jgi:Matrixin
VGSRLGIGTTTFARVRRKSVEGRPGRAPRPDELLLRPEGRRAREAVILHELGHLFGLAHVRDPRQLMYAETYDGMTRMGAGDQAGLAILGHGRCFSN